ncbi:hypothetical protein NG798_15920 [Ancylothrix sp. C2]|uniref:hypothetical protein n=1 Tax=Ancylothrix sp. D3o TaxID=2953691 RepID=UPI0021BA83D5|nr:hypothetical protein [Ancylothrix sp. D3o]MCT7951288.1 hypothetical protein [Ancylothrix sp. D3o]
MLTYFLAIKQIQIVFENVKPPSWQLSYQGQIYEVTFYPECFDERPGLQYMSWGNPLFEGLMGEVQKVLGVG